MSALVLATQRAAQPQGFAPLDNGNPICRDVYVWTPHAKDRLYGDRVFLATGEGSYSASPVSAKGVGRSWTRTAGAGVNFGTVQPISQNSGVTVLALAAPRSSTSLKSPFSQRVSGGAFTQTELVFNSKDSGGITAATAGSVMLASYHNTGAAVAADSQIDGNVHCWVAANGSQTGYIFRDGVKQTLSVNTRTPATLTATTQETRIGNFGASGVATTWVHDDPLYLVAVWDRVLSESEAASVSQNPWQLFKPVERRIWVPASTGGGTTYTITPSGAVSFSGTTTTTTDRQLFPLGTVDFSGTAPLTFTGAASSYLINPTGAVVFVGSSNIGWGRVMTPSGGLSMSGSSILPSTKNIVPEGAFALLGAATIAKDKILVSNGNITLSGTAPMSSNTIVESLSTKLTLTFVGKT